MRKLKIFLMAFLLGFAVNGFAQTDGLYYLYEVSNKQFLTHGEDWGTRAALDYYGSPVTWNSTEGSLKFKDNDLCLFKTGDGYFFTDNASTGFKFVETEGGYYLQTADGAAYAKLVDGAHLKCLMPTDNVAEAVVWQLKTKAERDAMVTDYVNQNYVNVINAAGLDITANDFLTELAKYTAVDKTSAIGTARFAGNVGDWTYVKGRDQGGQPAYGTDFCEIWQGTGRHTKTINGLTPGIYKVTVQGFERASGWAKCNELAAEGLEISTTTFTANGQHVAFKSWFSGKSDEKHPNNTGEAVAKFNEGKYQNEVYAYVGEDGILNLMVDKHAHVGDNWVLFNNFTLTYYEAPAAPAYTEVANIADVKKLENGTEFKLTLTDAKVTVQTFSMRGMMILLEDATGAIDVSEMSALEGFVEQNIINGTLYGVYRNEFGTIGLGLSENTEKSEITVQPGVVTPTKFTIADVKSEANYYKFVELNDCKTVYDEENYTWWAFSGTDSIAITDRFNKTVNWETGEQEIPANIKSMTGIVMFDGEKWVICPYAYGESKAIIAAVEEPKPTEPVVELTHTASSYCEGDANVWKSTVDAEKEHINNAKTSGTWNGFAYADFSLVIPEGHSVKSATLSWTGIGESRNNRNTDVMYANVGEQLDYEALQSGSAKVSLASTKITSVTIKKGASTQTDFTTDVSDAVKTITEAGQSNIIFIFTNNPAGGDLVGKGAAEKAPVLTVETVSAEDMTKYTVVAMVDADTVKVVSYDGVVGETATASAEDMAAFKNEDGSKKYIYVGGNSEITLVNDSASNIINLVFREAEKYRYSVVAKNGDGEMMQTLTNGQDFEGETIKVPYSRYILNYSDSTLYAADATNKEYNKSLTINEDGATLNITYKKTEINNVIALSEAEDVWGLTPITTGNASIRSSQSAAAYAAEEDVEVAYLTTGKYKMAAIIYDASKNLNSTFTFGIANDTILKATSTTANWTECVSDEFTVLGSNVPVVLHKGGSEIRGVDFFFIQKTGGVPSVVVENIADVKKVKSGTPVNLKLNNVKVTVQAYAMMGSFTVIEDATGAIPLSGNMALEGIYEKQALNGNLYVTYVNEWGSEQLDLADSTMYSNFTSEAAEVAPVEMTYAAVMDSSNMYRFVKLGACKTVFDEEMWMYYAVSGTDTLAIVDRFNKCLNWDTYETEIPAEVEYMTGLIMFDGEQWVIYPYAYGEDKAIVGVAQPEDIVVNVTEGEISAAVEAEKAKVAKVGNITVNLTAGAAYTIANTIEAPAGFILNGNGATIDASALSANFIQSAVTEEAKTVDSIAVLNVTVKGLGKALYYSAGKNIGISNFVVDNSVIEIAKDVVVFDFTKGSAAMNFAVKNSTIYAPTATTKSIYSSQGGEKGNAYGATVDTPQTFSFENTTLYNIAYNKNFFTHRSNGQKWLKFVVKNNVIVNSGKANFMTSVNGGQDSPNPIYDADAANSVGTLVDGAYTDLSASQTVQGNAMGTLVATNPGFKDVAAGDFTVYAGSEQAKEKIGDPRWLVEFDELLTGINGVNGNAAVISGDIYTINGVKVRNAGDSLNGLAKGLYIVNGKKFIVK